MDAFVEKPAEEPQSVIEVYVHRNGNDAKIKLPYNNQTTFEFIRNFAASWAAVDDVQRVALHVNGKKIPLTDLIADHVVHDTNPPVVSVYAVFRDDVVVQIPGLSKHVPVVIFPDHRSFGDIASETARSLDIPATALTTFYVAECEVGLSERPTFDDVVCKQDWILGFSGDTNNPEHPYAWVNSCKLFAQ